MRVLFLSRTLNPILSTSMGTGPLALLEGAKLALPDLTVTWMVSRKLEGIEVSPHDWIELNYGLRQTSVFDRLMAYMLTEETVELLKEDWDLILSNHVVMTPVLKQLTDVPILNLQMWSATARYVELHQNVAPAGEVEYMAEATGTVCAPNVWESSMQRAETVRTLSKYLNAETRETILSQPVLPLGIWMDRLDDVYARRQQRTRPGMFWGGDFGRPVKGWVRTEPIMYRAANATGAKVLVTTFMPEPEYPPFSSVPILWGQNRDGFYDAMSQGDVFVCNSEWESYGIAWLEMLGAGLLGVYEDSWWLQYVLPDWYPFVTADLEEMEEMATILLKQWPNGPLWEKYGEKTREWVRETQDQKLGGKRLAQVMMEMTK